MSNAAAKIAESFVEMTKVSNPENWADIILQAVENVRAQDTAPEPEAKSDNKSYHRPCAFSEGEVLYSSWGYDQTNVDFYMVERVTPKTVWLRKLDTTVEENEFMQGDCQPVKPLQAKGEVIRRRVWWGLDEPFVKINDYATAAKWDGKPKRCSWYA